MTSISLPSGATVWLRRQAYAHTPEHLYLSENPSYCAPYDSGRDFKLSPSTTGSVSLPLLISFSGNTVIVHTSGQPGNPWLHRPKTFDVRYERLSPLDAAAAKQDRLPVGWQRIEVPWGHNTCSL
jgi:hypothetical protein